MPAAGRQPPDLRAGHAAAGQRPALPVTAIQGCQRHSASRRSAFPPAPQGLRCRSHPTVPFLHLALCL
ncbi:hypothetical protein MG068_02995 [Stenotrophomonas sp. ASS1]|nr:hypothetical protein MG068_02995 [Stenotrophomonas sp. ASS1]QDY47698.1 hypothetical protein DUW70_03635 [Stenotrophomonas maltophilia]